jgi:hypothetical protein
MNRQKKLTSQQHSQEQQQTTQHQAETSAAMEFATPEEMLRHDAQHTVVPPRVAERLAESVKGEPPAGSSTSWWRRLFGGSGSE